MNSKSKSNHKHDDGNGNDRRYQQEIVGLKADFQEELKKQLDSLRLTRDQQFEVEIKNINNRKNAEFQLERNHLLGVQEREIEELNKKWRLEMEQLQKINLHDMEITKSLHQEILQKVGLN